MRDIASGMKQQTRTLHAHCARSMVLASRVTQRGLPLELYTERSLLIAQRGDVVCLHLPPDPSYLSYLQSLGLGPATEDILICPDSSHSAPLPLCSKLIEQPAQWNRVLERFRSDREIMLFPYMTTRFEMKLADSLRRQLPATVRVLGGNGHANLRFDEKHRIRQLAVQLGVPVAPGRVVEITTESHWYNLKLAIGSLLRARGTVLVRGSSGFTGTSVHLVSHENDIETRVEHIRLYDQNRIYLVEMYLDVVSSPNIGIYIDPLTHEISETSCTDQVTSEKLEHLGNRYPAQSPYLEDMVSAAKQIARQLSAGGTTGHVGFDFCEHRSSLPGPPFVLAELNPRMNGATYTHLLFQRLNESRLAAGNERLQVYASTFVPANATNYIKLEQLLGSLVYSPDQSTGVIPLFTGYLSKGKCGFMLVATDRLALAELETVLFERLGLSATKTVCAA